jgi:hypothetical protein
MLLLLRKLGYDWSKEQEVRAVDGVIDSVSQTGPAYLQGLHDPYFIHGKLPWYEEAILHQIEKQGDELIQMGT